MSTPTIAELHGHLKAVLMEVGSAATKLDLDAGKSQHLFSVALYCTAVEIANSFLELMGKPGSVTTLPTLARSLLEAHADLINLIEDESYIFQMKASFLVQRRKLIRLSASTGAENPYLAGVPLETHLDDLLSKTSQEIAECVAEGAVERLRIEDKFRRAGLLNEYQSLYTLLCLHAHNNINELERRHLHLSAPGKVQIKLLMRPQASELINLVDMVGACLVNILQHLCKLFDQDGLDDKAVEALSALRALYCASKE